MSGRVAGTSQLVRANEVDLDRCLDARFLRSAYQPIVELASRDIVGFEALARWPEVADANPAAVFAAARAAGRLPELEWACRTAAVSGAVSAGLGADATLFVNFDTSVPTWCESEDGRSFATAARELRVVVELTEGALVAHLADLMRLVDWVRDLGWGIALDDVGVHPNSLALLPLVKPDVVKLDLSLIQRRPDTNRAKVASAVLAHAERHPVAVVAEGIETEDHLRQAEALGATHGQGWMFGRPGAIHGSVPTAGEVPIAGERTPPAETPFATVVGRRARRVGTVRLLAALSSDIESQVRNQDGSVVLLASFQTRDRFTAAAADRYADLAERSPLVVAFARDMPPVPAPGVQGVSVHGGDPLGAEWSVVALGIHYAAALIARSVEQDASSADRTYEFVITHDREFVLAAARSLLDRLT